MSTTSNVLKPRYNPLLWAQLRPSTRAGASDSSQSVTSAIPLVPENKTNTSLRVVLHDTKSALEQFSGRLGKLVDGVEHAKREIDRVSSCFTEGHDKILEELNISVTRSQKGLLETLGCPAQATVLEEVKNSQGDTNRKMALLEEKAELVQRQLHAILEQQGHILASLATITPLTPLLRDSPQQQTQIHSMLTSLLPMLPLLQSLQAQLTASQEESISLKKSIATVGRSSALPLPLLHVHTEPCAPILLSSDSLPEQDVNRKLSRPDAIDEQQQNPPIEQGISYDRQPTPGLPSSRTLSSETAHLSCLPAHSVRSHVRQPVMRSDSASSKSLHKLTLSTVPGSDNSILAMRPPLMAPSENEISRDRKRPRLTDAVIQSKYTALHRIQQDTVTLGETFSDQASHVRSRPSTTGAKAISRHNSVRPAIPIVSHEHSPGPAHAAPDAFSPVPLTVSDRRLNASTLAISASTPRLKRSMTTGPFHFTLDHFSPSTPPFVRRGVSAKVCMPLEGKAKKPAENFSSRPYLSGFDEHASPMGFLPRKQLVRRNSQQRKLLNEDADEDVEIDLDWGDMVSS